MSLVKQSLIEEFKALAAKALEYRAKIETAKTYAKREIYKKKLKENNIKAAEVLTALEKVANAEEASRAAGAKDETLSIEGRSEAPLGVSASLE